MVSSSVIEINNKICLTELWRGLHKLMHLKCLEQKRAWYIIQIIVVIKSTLVFCVFFSMKVERVT